MISNAILKDWMGRYRARSCDLLSKTMAASTSMAEEVLAAIKLPNLKQIVAYLSENDAASVDTYVQSEYARDYAIDITNIHWGGEMHQGHVFDIYAEYSRKDSVQVRLDMLKFVEENMERYDWTAHLYLRMNQINLNTWTQKMTYWGNGADALAIYAMSDMLGVHTTIVTRTKPWTTIEGGIVQDVFELLELSAVKLVYLGKDRYARLRPKTDKCGPCFIGPNYNLTSMMKVPSLPSTVELDTANTLLELSESGTKSKPKPKLKPRPKPKPKSKGSTQLRTEVTATQSAPVLKDAMDKIVGYEEDPVVINVNFVDAMSQIIENEAPVPGENATVLDVETTTLRVNTKPCSVFLRRLEHILADELVTVPPSSATDLGEGEHFTRSRSRVVGPRTGRKSRRANTGVQYGEADIIEDKKSPKPHKPKPSRSGPSDQRIESRSKNTIHPEVTLPPIPGQSPKNENKDDVPSDETETYDEDDIPLSVVQQNIRGDDDTPPSVVQKNIRGEIKIKHHVLEKKPASRKYKCRMCRDSLPSCNALNLHHRKRHGILYCAVCKRPFNNPRSMTKHMYEHSNKKHCCSTCGQKFAFASQLTTHQLTHRKKPNQMCMYPNCGRKFKSKSDLNRHAATHTSKWLVCPDCDTYRTKDKRNFESHRQSHNQIERYHCAKCGQGFVHNTQKLRHIKTCEK